MAGRALRARLSPVVKTHRLDNFFANNDFLDSFFHNNNDNGGGGIEQFVEQESQSGDVSLGYSVTNSGDYASQCAPAIQFGNTGNFQNASSFVQYGSEADDFEPGGIEVSFDPQQGVQCSNTIQQSSATSSSGWRPPDSSGEDEPEEKSGGPCGPPLLFPTREGRYSFRLNSRGGSLSNLGTFLRSGPEQARTSGPPCVIM